MDNESTNRNEEEAAAAPSPKARVVRVFISSTFRDMQEERDILVKHIFPEIRKKCRQRSVEFVEIDLRWGITEAQTERGEVLPVCLAEIENCRPYFIGLLGERYGWAPKKIDKELLETQPWLTEHLHKSVTELEILHGVLNNPDMAGRSFFYFRDPAYVDRAPGKKKDDLKSEGPEAADKLKELKDKIKKSGLPVREGYPDPKALGMLIKSDLWDAIDKEFSEGEPLDPLAQEAADHEAFLLARAKIYIGRQDYFTRLDNHVKSNDKPIVVLGESGSGKSALLANWIIKYRQENPDDFLLVHFTGSTPKSADYRDIMLRVIKEIKRRYDLPNEIPATPAKLKEEFPNWLSMAGAHGKFVLILDGLNQLEDTDGAPDLVWLPEFIPPEVRLIVSTLPGRSLDALEKRNWQTLRVAPLSETERIELINEYLYRLYRRRLSETQVTRIAIAKQSASPLYLKALLEELKVLGIHEELDNRIDHYLQAKTIDDLYEKVLERLEEDYENDRPNLVGEAMSLIWASRRGLSESELMDLLNVPRAYWSPLYLALEESIISRSGLLNFFHDYLRQAVKDKYLSSVEDEHEAHQRLADYFDKRELDKRQIDELPLQLAKAGAWQHLSELLSGEAFFSAAWATDQYEVKSRWSEIENNSDISMLDAYKNVIAAPEQNNSDFIWQTASLLADTGRLDQAFRLRECLTERYRLDGDKNRLQASLGKIANIFYLWGRLDEAMSLYKEQEKIGRELQNQDSLQKTLGNQALILRAWGLLDEAMSLLKEQACLCKELDDMDSMQISLGNQSAILYAWG